ncbi:hypothetical protein NEMBOFW57_010298 [Staphylotrichum longicolle]|uniref:Uncharacterized protein n=1 Tax=Staphylotrichum longicolle TaxID=669026 RepID=A0AAD4EMX1_9PEZI|nr:hypothetical protein NEMBOFW57_010298 [Staphylotrichum longicolle]
MNPATKTIVATGASSGLGFEVIKQLLTDRPLHATDRYRLILGARDVARTQIAYDALRFDSARHSLAVLPLDLEDLGATQAFAKLVVERLDKEGAKVEYLLLNAGLTGENEADGAGVWGLIPQTGIGKGSVMKLTMDLPDAKTVPEGAQNILRAFTRDDFPEDPEQIFLTSWGEWWSKDVYALSLDKALQDKWCPSKEEIEREAGLSA